MNIYELHNNPQELNHYEERYKNPQMAYSAIYDEARRTAYKYHNNELINSLLPYIIKHPKYAYLYAVHILNARWYAAEPYIMKDPEHAFDYAIYVLKERWYGAEEYIAKYPEMWSQYQRHFQSEF